MTRDYEHAAASWDAERARACAEAGDGRPRRSHSWIWSFGPGTPLTATCAVCGASADSLAVWVRLALAPCIYP